MAEIPCSHMSIYHVSMVHSFWGFIFFIFPLSLVCHKSILYLCKSNCFMLATLSNLLILLRVGLELSSKIVPAPYTSTWHKLAANYSFPSWYLKERNVASQREQKAKGYRYEERLHGLEVRQKDKGWWRGRRQSERRVVRFYVDHFIIIIFNRGRWKAVMVSTSKKKKMRMMEENKREGCHLGDLLL